MKEVSLFEHNEVAYKKLCETLRNNKCATINHATGTGKSFIALKFLYENRDKKYLYIAPTYPIIEQLLQDCYKIGLTPKDINIDTMIYRNLLKMDMDELYKKYDGIIFDEYHRSGAKETYKQIKRLKLNLQDSDDKKKFIGLTATPVRYLDRERNMTEEIFDGIVASNISLAQAMLEGLLPVPLYINSKIACREEYNDLERKIKRFSPSKKRDELERRLKKIGKNINNGEIDNKKMISQYIREKNGKYVVFCKNITELNKIYDEIDTWFSSLGKIKKYKVFSEQEDLEYREKGIKKRNYRKLNQDNLDEFNNDKDGISVLLCIDILNEGVHVDDIDGVILLRKTISPIIYFQQIGRALSFSGRNKQIKIFDLVNNFGNHNAIDAVYEEFEAEVKKQMELHPEKREQYEETMSKFKIMDETREILTEFKQIRKEFTSEKIKNSKIEYAINVLRTKINNNKIFDYEDTREAYMTLSKYYKYVNDEQFKALLELDIILPVELSMTYEERLKKLAGFDSIFEKEKAEYKLCINEIIEFIKSNNRKPNINSNDEQEVLLAKIYLEYMPNLNEEIKTEIMNVMDSIEGLKYEPWEKALFGKTMYSKDIDELINMANAVIQAGNILPQYLQEAIQSVTINYNIKKNEELFRILEVSENFETERKKKSELERSSKVSRIIGFIEQNIDLREKQLIENGILHEIRGLNSGDRSYIKRKYIDMKEKRYREIINGTENEDISTFCKRMIGINENRIHEYQGRMEQNIKKYEFLEELMKFMISNGGKMPNMNSENVEEKNLALILQQYTSNGMLSEKFSNLEFDMQSQWYSASNIMKGGILEEFSETNIKITILKCMEFFCIHGRKPLKNSLDEAERNLAIEYEKECISRLSQDKIALLNKAFNSKKSLHKTCEAYINNIKASQDGR